MSGNFYKTVPTGQSYVSSVFHWHFGFTSNSSQAGPSNMVEIDGHPYQFMAFRKLKPGTRPVTLRLLRVEPLPEDQVEEVSFEITLMTQLVPRILGTQMVSGTLTSKNLTLTSEKFPSESSITNYHAMISFSNRSIEKPVSRFEGLFPDTPTTNVEITSSKGVAWTTVHKDAILHAIPHLLKHVKVKQEGTAPALPPKAQPDQPSNEPTPATGTGLTGLDILRLIQSTNICSLNDSINEEANQDLTNRSDGSSAWEEMDYEEDIRSPTHSGILPPKLIPHPPKTTILEKETLSKTGGSGASSSSGEEESGKSTHSPVPEAKREIWVCPESWDRNAVSRLVYWCYTGQTSVVKDLDHATSYLQLCKALDLKTQFQETLYQAQLFIREHPKPFELVNSLNFKANNGVAKTLRLELSKAIKARWSTVVQDMNLQAALNTVDPSGMLLEILAKGVPK